jgi:hypothetical protein
VIRDRLAAQLLAGPPARDAVAVVERLLAVQAQDARGVVEDERTVASGAPRSRSVAVQDLTPPPET